MRFAHANGERTSHTGQQLAARDSGACRAAPPRLQTWTAWVIIKTQTPLGCRMFWLMLLTMRAPGRGLHAPRSRCRGSAPRTCGAAPRRPRAPGRSASVRQQHEWGQVRLRSCVEVQANSGWVISRDLGFTSERMERGDADERGFANVACTPFMIPSSAQS